MGRDHSHLAALTTDCHKISHARDARARVVVEQHHAPVPRTRGDDPMLNALVLSVGASDLCAYAKGIAETLTTDGVRGDLTLPILTFELDSENSAS